jgi:hypothetical protein
MTENQQDEKMTEFNDEEDIVEILFPGMSSEEASIEMEKINNEWIKENDNHEEEK